MNEVRSTYYTLQLQLFPLLEENLVELTPKLRTLLETIELVRPGDSLDASQRRQWTGRAMHSREHMARAFIAKSIYNLPTPRLLVELLKGDAIPLLQKAAARCKILCVLVDKAYDCKEIRAFAKSLGIVPVIDLKSYGEDKRALAPAKKARYRQRSSVERSNSDMKDNYGAPRTVRVRGHLKVFCHLMFGILAIAAKQLFAMFT